MEGLYCNLLYVHKEGGGVCQIILSREEILNKYVSENQFPG